MDASTRVAAIASDLSVSWTGFVGKEQASVVLLWPKGEKVYLDIIDGEAIIGDRSDEKCAKAVRSYLTD